MADAMIAIGELRQELSFIRGTMEEADFDRGSDKGDRPGRKLYDG